MQLEDSSYALAMLGDVSMASSYLHESRAQCVHHNGFFWVDIFFLAAGFIRDQSRGPGSQIKTPFT